MLEWHLAILLPPTPHPIAPSSNLLLPAVASLVVVVLLLIICVAVLVLALAVTATKLKKSRAETAHTDSPQNHTQTGGEGKTTDEIYEEMGDGMSPTQQQRGLYQELTPGTMEKGQYEVINRNDYTAKA